MRQGLSALILITYKGTKAVFPITLYIKTKQIAPFEQKIINFNEPGRRAVISFLLKNKAKEDGKHPQ